MAPPFRHLILSLGRQLQHLSGSPAIRLIPRVSLHTWLSTFISSQRAGAVLSTSPLLLPSPCMHPTASMKTHTALKRRCKDCFFVRRRGRLFVFCKTNPRHKQRQG